MVKKLKVYFSFRVRQKNMYNSHDTDMKKGNPNEIIKNDIIFKTI